MTSQMLLADDRQHVSGFAAEMFQLQLNDTRLIYVVSGCSSAMTGDHVNVVDSKPETGQCGLERSDTLVPSGKFKAPMQLLRCQATCQLSRLHFRVFSSAELFFCGGAGFAELLGTEEGIKDAGTLGWAL
jgi:hypothetical protein